MDSDNLFTECPGCGTTDAPVRTEETANAVAFRCQQCGVVWITDRHGEPEILPPKPTVDSDLRTKLEALVSELESKVQQADELRDLRYEEGRVSAASYCGAYGDGCYSVLLNLRALLAEDSDPSAADG